MANQIPKPLHPRYVMLQDTTDGEDKALEALRQYRAAETNPQLRAELDAWDALRTYVDVRRHRHDCRIVPGVL